MRFMGIVLTFMLGAMVVCGDSTARAQTDVAASFYGAFNQSTSGNNVKQSPSNAAGVLLELRHISNPLVGYEFTYSYNRANQKYSNGCFPNCISFATVTANAHEISGDWVASVKAANLRPFALAGVGVIFDEPVQNAGFTGVCDPPGGQGCSTTQASTKPVFVYGAGLDWTLLPHLGLHLEYRGNLYKAPNMVKIFSSTDAFTQTSEPMVGVFFRL